jgi:hypothetical protein
MPCMPFPLTSVHFLTELGLEMHMYHVKCCALSLFHSISICTAAQGLTHPVVPSRFCPAPPAPPDSPPPARRRRPCATPTTSSRGRLGRRTSAPPPRAAVWAGPRAPAPSSRPAGGRPRPRQDFSWCKWVDLLCAGAFFKKNKWPSSN